MPLLLRPESSVAFDAFRDGVIELPDMSRRTPVFLRSAGDPLADTDDLIDLLCCNFLNARIITKRVGGRYGTDADLIR